MSEFLKVTKLSDRAGTGAVNFSNGFNINGSDSGISSFTHTEGATEPSSPSNGDTWWDSDNDIYKVYMNNEWKDWLGTTASSVDWKGTRGISLGGDDGANSEVRLNTIQYINISAGSGNATDFGDLTALREECPAASSNARIICAGGKNDSGTIINNIDYIASATTGNSTDFGDLESAKKGHSVCGDGTYGIFMGGISTSNNHGDNKIQRVTIASTGNATDFGDLTENYIRYSSSTNDTTRGVRCAGTTYSGSSTQFTNVIDYITMANAGNATDFGDVLQGVYFGQNGVISNNTIGIFGGGYKDSNYAEENVIQKITIQTTGNATDFGDMINGYGISIGGTTDGTTGVWLGGKSNQGNATNVISKVTIATPGNATDFGDMLGNIRDNGSASGAAS